MPWHMRPQQLLSSTPSEAMRTSYTTDTNAIEALVVRLRRKIAPEAIETRRGFGYCLAGDSQ